MQILRKQLSDLTPAGYNPRSITPEALDGLRASIHRFGLVEPIIWNERTGNVVGGHQRLRVLLADGVTETDVVVVDLPDTEEKALNIALNNPAIAGDFTDEIRDLVAEIEREIPDAVDELILGGFADDIEAIGNDEDIKTKTAHNFWGVEAKNVSVQIGDISLIIGADVYERLLDALKTLYDTDGEKFRDTFEKMLSCCIDKIRNN